MVRAAELAADAKRFREYHTGGQVLDGLRDMLALFGATLLLVSGVPMPGRAVEGLVPDGGPADAAQVAGDDAIWAHVLGLCGAQVFVPAAGFAERSALYRTALAAGLPELLCCPVRRFAPFQGAVIAGGADLALDRFDLLGLDYVSEEAFRQLLALDALPAERPGDLSGRERRVVELSAAGKTASDIAETLAISQRTVHAHLQNASDKLRARNKTQTVVQALRYGQITL